MKVRELIEYLDCVIPCSLSCEWDNDGVMVCVNDVSPVKRILLTLDVTKRAIGYAFEHGCDTIISHHPLIFRPIRSLSDASVSSSAAMLAVCRNINILSYHTRLDALPIYGVNDTLAPLIGVFDTVPFGPDGEEIGRIGTTDHPLELTQFCSYVKERLCVGHLIVTDSGRNVNRVALIGGDGKDYLMDAIAAGADTFLTGRCGYNIDIDASQYMINVIEAGHYNTEAHVLKSVEKLISEKFDCVEFMYYNSDMTEIV